jgi:hypothetical protein
VTGRKRITAAEAAQMTRGQLVDRLYEESERWQQRPPRSDADRAAYAEFTAALHMIDPGAGLDAAKDTLEGRPNNYWETRPADERREPEAGQ